MQVTFEELFGETYIDTPTAWTFNTREFDRVGLSTYVVETPSVLAAIHEMFILSLVGSWVDENGLEIGDGTGDEVEAIIYNYVNFYDDIKCTPLNKRREGGHLIWSYLWSFPNRVVELPVPNINPSLEIVSINGDTVSIDKDRLNNPTTVEEFIIAFATYILVADIPGITVRDGIFVDISTTDTDLFDIDKVIGG